MLKGKFILLLFISSFSRPCRFFCASGTWPCIIYSFGSENGNNSVVSTHFLQVILPKASVWISRYTCSAQVHTVTLNHCKGNQVYTRYKQTNLALESEINAFRRHADNWQEITARGWQLQIESNFHYFQVQAYMKIYSQEACCGVVSHCRDARWSPRLTVNNN